MDAIDWDSSTTGETSSLSRSARTASVSPSSASKPEMSRTPLNAPVPNGKGLPGSFVEDQVTAASVAPSNVPSAAFQADSSTVPSAAEVVPLTASRLAVRSESA